MDLENQGIFLLRSLARNLGIKAPTTKTKKVLIAEINEILQTNNIPRLSSKSGRKPLNLIITSEITGLENYTKIILNSLYLDFVKLENKLLSSCLVNEKLNKIMSFETKLNQKLDSLVEYYYRLK